MFGGGDRIAERRVHDDDAARGCRRNVDVIDTDARAANDFQVFGLFKDLRRHLGRRANSKAVKVRDRGCELLLVLAQCGLKIHVDAAILEDLHGRRRERVGNEHFGHGWPHAALVSEAFASANAQSSQGVSAWISFRSTVAPHQMRRPGGASR